jgi:hypothetical protein
MIFKLKKDSHLRDSMFWYIIIVTIIYFGAIGWGLAQDKVPGLSDDLSGKKYPIPVVRQEGMDFTETTVK